MKRFGTRFNITSYKGSHWSFASITMRGRRRYPMISVPMSNREFPGPAWRLNTTTGPGRGVGGSSMCTRSPNVLRAIECTLISHQRMKLKCAFCIRGERIVTPKPLAIHSTNIHTRPTTSRAR
jgi:hypothetical protein